jgi:hypothetical protein
MNVVYFKVPYQYLSTEVKKNPVTQTGQPTSRTQFVPGTFHIQNLSVAKFSNAEV